ncbi:MAG: HAAS signaling domain-containing protein [Thermoplasmata archaeon]
MKSEAEYLADVRRAMGGMAATVRNDILRELRGHIADSTATNGGDVTAALVALGPAREVGHRYRELYGYGTSYKVLFAGIAFVLAVPSVPVLVVGTENLFPFALSILFVIGCAAWILWVSIAAGSRAGVFAGVAGMVGRFAGFGFAAVTQAGAVTTPGALGLFVAVSAMFVVLGWIPGTAKRVWSGPRPDL